MLLSIAKKGQSMLLLSFAFFIAIGTASLKLFGAVNSGGISWIDSFFMATSAVCVTGLSTVSVAEMNWVGQFILLLLIQIGGIGIMTLSASILLSLGKGLSFSNTLLISSLNDNFSLRGTEGLTKIVLKYVLFSEAVGMVLLYVGSLLNGTHWLKALWEASFVAVSSFCNAGLVPYPGSMSSQHILTRLTCTGLIIAGGLGVYVIYDLIQVFKKRQQKS